MTANVSYPGLVFLDQVTGLEVVDLVTTTVPEIGVRANVLGGCPLAMNFQPNDYTLVLSDTGAAIAHPSTDNVTRTYTIPSNASVPYTVGTVLTFVNEASTVLIAINADTMTLAGSTSTGTRTLTACGIASALKTGPTRWVIAGANLT